jgi:hexosaminidase
MNHFSFAAVLVIGASSSFAASPSWSLMPWPKKVEAAGAPLRLDRDFRIEFTAAPPARLERAARRFLSQLTVETGVPITSSRTTRLVVECCAKPDAADRLGDDEAYTLHVSTTQARLEAETVTGALRGLQTLLQLARPDAQGFAIAGVRVEDSPRFPWRGLLLDVTSHFMPVAVIKRNLDAMEAVKLNVFHWHLTDDQGFRIESGVFPKLHTLGSAGDYYTRQEIRDVIDYAHDRGIRVVPEIDMPGHSGTWMIGYPELGSASGPYAIIPTFGVYDPTLDPTQDRVYTFIDELLGEISALFPDEYLHIGGDEVNGKHWKANAGIQKFIRERGLKNEAGLQAYFNRRVEAIVRKHGKKMMGWDEVLHPNLPRDIVVQSWRDHESLATAIKQGHPALLSFGYYLDHLDTSKVYYLVDPLGGPATGLSESEARGVLGGEACMWTEFVSPETVDSRIWPMTAAIAERLWSSRSVTDLASMFQRLDVVSRRLDWRGVRHNTNYESMLRRLSETAPLEDLRVLADAVEPLGIDGREITRTYSQSTPLNRFVDAARGESAAVRRAEAEAAAVSAGGSGSELERTFRSWRENAARLNAHFDGNALLKEAADVSRNLSRTGEIGLEALGRLRARQSSTEWATARLAELEALGRPQVEVRLVAVKPVRHLLMALQRAGK